MKIYDAYITMAMFAMLILIFLVLKNETISKTTKKGIVFCAILIMIGEFSEALGVILDGSAPAFRTLHSIVKFTELSVTPLIPVFFATAFNPFKARKYILLVLLCHAVLEFLSMFFGITFFVDAQNVYHHCNFYFIYYIAIAVSAGYLIYTVSDFHRRYQSRNFVELLLIAAFVLTGIVLQAVDSEMRVTWTSVSIGMFMFYIYYCSAILHTDALTELLNRRSFEKHISEEKKRVGILFFDVNRFKYVNDNYGHGYGDECLETIAKALKTVYGKYGYCYRIGGDEFCVILHKNVDSADEMNETLVSYLDEKRKTDEKLPSVAVGYAVFDPKKETATDALGRADKAMYSDKSEMRSSSLR